MKLSTLTIKMNRRDSYAIFTFLQTIKNDYWFMKMVIYNSLTHFNEAAFKSLSAL